MNRKRIIGICLIIVFSVSAIVSGRLFWKEYRDAKASEEAFSSLAGLVQDTEQNREEDGSTGDCTDTTGIGTPDSDAVLSDEEMAAEEAAKAYEKYGALYEQNNDFVGWIQIDGTNINYPVMQTPDNPDYYLKHSFEKTWSDYGVPYLDEACVIGQSNNLVIYGHHMSNGSMFCDLELYSDPAFCMDHPVIRFDTLTSFGEYEVIAVFRYNTNQETFRYDREVNMDEGRFSWFIEQVHARELFSTGKDASFGDQLLTLSTCEYTYKNGRLVVVARKVVQ